MATQAENKRTAELLLEEGKNVVAHLSDIKDNRAMLRKVYDEMDSDDLEGRTHYALLISRQSQAMDEKGKKLMGIWAQAQVYATLANVPDNLPEAWTPVPRPHPSKALSPLDWMHAQAASNFPNACVRVRKIYDQDNDEIYEIRVDEEGGKVTRYSFIPDKNASDPYKLGPSEAWRRHDQEAGE